MIPFWRSIRTSHLSLVVLLVFIPVLFSGCQSLPGSEPGEAVPVEGEAYGGSFNVLFEDRSQQERWQVATPAPNSFDPTFAMMRVRPGEPLVTRVGLSQTYPDAKNVRLMLLVDFRQVPFSFAPLSSDRSDTLLTPPATPPGGEPSQMSATVFLEPGIAVFFRLTVAPLPAGYHDLALVISLDPEKTQSELRYSTALAPVARAGLYVGDATPPSFDTDPLDPNPVEDASFGGLCLLTPDPDSVQNWPGRTVKAGEDIDLYLRLQPFSGSRRPSAPDSEPIVVALVGFLEDTTIDLNGEPVIYGTVRLDTLSTITITFHAPDQPGQYQFFVHQFPNPYAEQILADPGDRSFDGRACQRIVLDVEAP